MRWPLVALCIVQASWLIGGLQAAAEEVECTRYVPAVGKIVRVPCDDGRPPQSGAQSSPEPAMHFSPAELDKVAPLRRQLAQLSATMRAAHDDHPFRDRFCTAVAMASLVQRTRGRKEKKRLFDETVVMQAELGERGRMLSTALTKVLVDPLLDTPVNEATGARVRHTQEGVEFVYVRDRFQLGCSCLRDPKPPRRLMCCDNCGLIELKSRLEAPPAGSR